MSERLSLRFAAVVAVLLALAAGAWLLGCGSRETETRAPDAAKTAKYHCPMHPTMVSDRPGDCPICHMRLVPIEEEHKGEGDKEPAKAPPAKRIIYRSTMNPNEVSDKPGKDSMGMDMVPVEVEEEAPAAASPVAGLSAVRISTRKQQLIGTRTSVVTRLPFRRTIRTVGRVTYDETRLHHVHTKVSGYLERLHANATGELVRRGQPLLEIYSPELLASQQEYLLALKARSRMAGSSIPSVAGSGEELVASARRRLELFDLTDDQIAEIEETGRARRTVTLYAPMSGHIIKRYVTHGERVEPEMALLDLANLSSVWVLASIYEYEHPFVRVGQKATVTLPYVPGTAHEGRVSLIYPVLDPATRTVQVRIELPNPGLVLKPDMYADVALEADLGERLAVPDTAVIETGTRSVVFVAEGDGLFEPREITVGLRLPDAYEIVSGLTEGESVITSGNFFIDSESKLKAALAAMAEGPAASGHTH